MKKVLYWSVLLALMLVVFTVSYAFGCQQDDSDGTSLCVPAKRVTSPPPNPTAAPKAAIVPVRQAMGTSPEDGMTPMFVRSKDCIDMMCPGANSAPGLQANGDWKWIAPNSKVWYKVDDWGSLQVSLWLFANGQQGLQMAVYAPDQKDVWNTKPVGVGSRNPVEPGDLFYTGRTSANGIWHIAITNNSPVPVSYSLRFTISIPYNVNRCDACHGPLKDLMWDRCTNGSGSNWCSDLQDFYNTNPPNYDHHTNPN